MVVFAGIRFLCRAGPMCPAAGYAFFGGAHGPRPTGRYVEPRVGDGVPQWSAAEQMPLGYDVPSARQRRAVIARRAATRQSVPLPKISPSKSQQFPAKFCAYLQNMKILPETVAVSMGGCYI